MPRLQQNNKKIINWHIHCAYPIRDMHKCGQCRHNNN